MKAFLIGLVLLFSIPAVAMDWDCYKQCKDGLCFDYECKMVCEYYGDPDCFTDCMDNLDDCDECIEACE